MTVRRQVRARATYGAASAVLADAALAQRFKAFILAPVTLIALLAAAAGRFGCSHGAKFGGRWRFFFPSSSGQLPGHSGQPHRLARVTRAARLLPPSASR